MKAQLDLAAPDIPLAAYQTRISEYAWDRIASDLDTYGAAVLPGLLSADECATASNLFALATDTALSRIPPVEDQRSWGNGVYRYVRYPMPKLMTALRTDLFPHLAPIANAWNEKMEIAERFPMTHQEYLAICQRAGQTLPTSMLLEHGVGQQTLLHQDVYGDHTFPLQAAVVLSQRGIDYAGGEFVITEQRPRMQTRPEVVALNKGDAVVFAVSNRPVGGTRGTYRVNLRHGFSKVREGRQLALSIIFHDAAA
ncbi:MAG: proline hydroxylase [Agrobacterium fabrum]|uniref:Proline hydroxylase n=1 Tax=Agrobacterium fabrum TaxID=1176649 RepID=A0A2W5FFE5_9HYPH|nr:MAG: proline hydroxylase [Agrobacterium fabrum]